MNNLQFKFDNFQRNQQDFQKKFEQKQDDFHNQMMQFMQNLYNKPSTSNSSSLPSNTILNPKREAKAITTRSDMSYKEPPIPPPGVNQLPTLNDMKMVLELADETISKPTGVAENVFVKVDKFYFPANFVILDFVTDPRVPIILGRPFLSTAHAIINVFEREIIIRQNQQSLTIQCSDIPSVKKIEEINKIEFINTGGIDYESEEIEDFLNDDSIQLGVEDSLFNMDKDILFLESLLRDDPIPPHPINPNQKKLPIKETYHSFKMGYEHFNTNLPTKHESEPRQEEIDVVSETNDVLPPRDDDSDDEVNVDGDLRVDNIIQNSEHEYSESEDSDLDNPLLPLPPPEPLDKEFDFEIDFEKRISVERNLIVKFEYIDARMKFDVENDVFKFIMFSLLSAESEDTIFDHGLFSRTLKISCVGYCPGFKYL
nr:reverse transcriptase domain-containing protein [Tanacetum cinerariifolium]